MSGLYLCGPINGCSDTEANDWRELVIGLWGGRCINPMDRDYRGREAAAFREIVELDKADIDAADALLVNHDRPSVGTSMEILYAWERGKPVFVVSRPDAVISPWLRYHATAIVQSFAEAVRLAENHLNQQRKDGQPQSPAWEADDAVVDMGRAS